MKVSDFCFDLPAHLIARTPLKERSQSRLLVYDRQTQSSNHHHFFEIKKFLKPGDCLVLNNTKVLPARLFGNKQTGGKVELLLERVLDEKNILCHVKASKAPKIESLIRIADSMILELRARKEALFHFELKGDGTVVELLETYGHVPLPPYIDRVDTEEDKVRYQTVYAKEKGAVAAPTAGLHFTESLLSELKEMGVTLCELTLHVGAGTFQPVRVDDILAHQMHSEWAMVSESAVEKILNTKAMGGRVIAVGTTVVRSLETAGKSGQLKPFCGETDIFIYPGFEFKVIDAMVTNFHLPESTLIMLVSAFIGRQQTLDLYQQAIDNAYRFFSYGDATLLL